jgi:hypothetical protein
VWALQDLAHHRFGRIVGIDRAHIGAVDHDVGDFELGEVEQAADAVAILAHHEAVAAEIVDRAAQLVLRRALRLDARQLIAEHGKQARAHGNDQQDEDGKDGDDGPAGVHLSWLSCSPGGSP